jgi:hypothetical protein
MLLLSDRDRLALSLISSLRYTLVDSAINHVHWHELRKRMHFYKQKNTLPCVILINIIAKQRKWRRPLELMMKQIILLCAY